MAYLFDPQHLHEIARKHLGLPRESASQDIIDPQHLRDRARQPLTSCAALSLSCAAPGHNQSLPRETLFQNIIDDLARAYPGHIETRQNWLFNLAGGCVGIMSILHASLSEYVLLFGTPIGAQGFSGRYLMDVYDFLLAGELIAYTEQNFHEPVLTRPGELALLRRWQVKGFKLSAGSWMLEYGRGIIPASLPFALGDALFSCFDVATIAKTMWLYGKMVVKELWKGKI